MVDSDTQFLDSDTQTLCYVYAIKIVTGKKSAHFQTLIITKLFTQLCSTITYWTLTMIWTVNFADQQNFKIMIWLRKSMICIKNFEKILDSDSRVSTTNKYFNNVAVVIVVELLLLVSLTGNS